MGSCPKGSCSINPCSIVSRSPFLYLGREEHDVSSFTPQQSSPCLEHLHGLRGRTVAGLASGTSLQTKRVIVGLLFELLFKWPCFLTAMV